MIIDQKAEEDKAKKELRQSAKKVTISDIETYDFNFLIDDNVNNPTYLLLQFIQLLRYDTICLIVAIVDYSTMLKKILHFFEKLFCFFLFFSGMNT